MAVDITELIIDAVKAEAHAFCIKNCCLGSENLIYSAMLAAASKVLRLYQTLDGSL